MNILFISLGCDKNLVDSEFMIGSLTKAGHQLVDSEEEADVIVVNSCCFINDAKEESIQTILDMAGYKEKGRLKRLIVTGCLSERYKDEILKEIPEVDAILGTNSYNHILDAVEGKCEKQFETLNTLPDIKNDRVLSTPGHYAHLKIAEGCNKNCAYCVIPSIRGPYRSVPMETLIAQAKQLVSQGVKELILVAQETTLYGVDLYKKKSLHLLLDELNKIPGLYWIRIMYCYPEEIYDELIESIKRNKKVCHYLDMPIQHANDEILKRMNRRTNHKELVDHIEKIRREIPDITLRTTLIAGFPGETKEQHEEMMQFVNNMEFDRLGAFTYSPEEGTVACEMPDQVDEEVKEDWANEIMELSEEVIADKNQDLIGKEFMAIIEGKVADENSYVGRTYRDAPDIDGYVFIQTDTQLITGDFVKVKITGAYEYDLIGELVE
ncbi:MAG: 30S ribosomal protein S12 methylthiotransferase RimO [Lachnospiraceae bacterium]|nr:30S ribosomal protein S12 methylthiotransferase RimO [Lachnospiraceae bacterium]